MGVWEHRQIQFLILTSRLGINFGRFQVETPLVFIHSFMFNVCSVLLRFWIWTILIYNKSIQIYILGKLFQFISVSLFFQHFEDILKIPQYTDNCDNFGHYYRGVKFSYHCIPTCSSIIAHSYAHFGSVIAQSLKLFIYCIVVHIIIVYSIVCTVYIHCICFAFYSCCVQCVFLFLSFFVDPLLL